MFCREQAAHFQAAQDDFASAGVDLVAVGNGTAPMASDFVQRFGITFPVYTDPKGLLFKAAGMNYVMGIKLRSFKYAARAIGAGHFQGRTKGRPKWQGGVLLIDTKGDVLYEFQDPGPGEHLPPAQVLETVTGVLGPA